MVLALPMKLLSVKRVRYTSMHWYPPPVEARITTPRHRPRPRQTVAQIEAMYHGGTPMASLRLSTRLWRVRQLQPNTPVHLDFM